MRKFKKCLFTGTTGSGASFLIEHILKQDKDIKIYGLYRSIGYKKILEHFNDAELIDVNSKENNNND